MRPFRSHASRWPISVLCILSVCLTLCTTIVLTPSSARAQVAGITQVAVIDFRNASSMPGQMFGRMATDAVVLELIRSGKFGVIPSDSLEATMKQLGYDSNMNQAAMIRLGQEAEATSVVSGEVLSIKLDKKKKKAEARIAVKLLDVASGEVVNGAVASGISQPRVGYTADDDKMLVEAIKDAARNAVETMVTYIIPEATVLNTVGTSEVLLNKGSQEGLEPGMEMIVLRRMDGGQEEVVGRIKITKTSDSDAMGAIIKAPRGVKPEDRVRAVYKMPDYSASDQVAAPKRTSRKSITNGSKLLWGLVALVGIAALMGGGGSKSDDLPSAAAMAARDPGATSGFTDNTILVVWNTPKNVGEEDIMEYHVWRDNQGLIFGTTNGGGNNVGPVLVTPRDRAPWPIGGVTYDHHTVDLDVPRGNYDFHYGDPDTGALNTVSIESMIGLVPYTKQHQYWVSALYRRYHQSTGTYTYHETALSYAGAATVVSPPQCVMPDGASDLPLSSITFEWEPSQGADLYRIEVSTDPEFARNVTYCKDVRLVDAPSYQCTLNLSNAPEMANIQAGQTLYWRVGARKIADRPGPMPAGDGSSVAASGPKNTRFIYGDGPLSFTIDMPPGGDPGDGGTGGGDDGGGPPPLPNI